MTTIDVTAIEDPYAESLAEHDVKMKEMRKWDEDHYGMPVFEGSIFRKPTHPDVQELSGKAARSRASKGALVLHYLNPIARRQRWQRRRQMLKL